MTPFLFIIIEVNRGPGMIPKVNGCWHQDHKKKQKKQKNYVWEFTKLQRTVGGLLDIHHNEES